MSESLTIPIERLIAGFWDTMKILKITAEQQHELLNNKKLEKKYYIFPAGHEFPLHSHEKAQLLLVMEGELTHVYKNKEYKQTPLTLLIVPTNTPHTAFVSKTSELKAYALTKIQ